MMDAVAVVTAWHVALNAGNEASLLALVDEAVELRGPRGTGHGAALLREWVGRAGLRLDPGRVFHNGEAVVVEEVARWHAPESGDWGDPLVVASAFRVADGRVRRIERFEDVIAALAAVGLDGRDEVAADAHPGRCGRSGEEAGTEPCW